MKGIVSGLQNIWSSILTLVNGVILAVQFLINLVKSLFEMIKILVTTVTNTTTLILTLPPWLIAFATATIGVAVLYVIIGRETGKNK